MTEPTPHPAPLVASTAEAAVFRLEARVLDEPLVRLVDRQRAWLEGAGRGLHLDLAGVEAATAGGLGRLVALHRDLRDAGGGLVLHNVGAGAYEVFRLTGLTGLLDVRKDGCAA